MQFFLLSERIKAILQESFFRTVIVFIRKSIIFGCVIILLLSIYRCVDPFIPSLGTYKPMLVVEALLTDRSEPGYVKLSYSFQNKDSVLYRVNDATVYITDDLGTQTNLSHSADGIYKTDSSVFRAETGRTYQLHILTSDGNVYQSDSCTMLPVPGIDSVYFTKDWQFVDNQRRLKKGISVFADSKPGPSETYYVRWSYDEIWKFRVPFPTTYKYINSEQILMIPKDSLKDYCWKNAAATEILINEVMPGISDRIMKKHIKFIAPDQSDRITVRYSILVKLYSLSKQAFKYLEDLQKVDESEGDIFGSQPFEILSNIKNTSDPAEKVLGYFQVSSVSEKRKYIIPDDIYTMGFFDYEYDCKVQYVSTKDFYLNPLTGRAYTFDEIYDKYARGAQMIFTRPVFHGINADSLYSLGFSTPECANCEYTGSHVKPAFWKDKN
jgi:hypothetical protein